MRFSVATFQVKGEFTQTWCVSVLDQSSRATLDINVQRFDTFIPVGTPPLTTLFPTGLTPARETFVFWCLLCSHKSYKEAAMTDIYSSFNWIKEDLKMSRKHRVQVQVKPHFTHFPPIQTSHQCSVFYPDPTRETSHLDHDQDSLERKLDLLYSDTKKKIQDFDLDVQSRFQWHGGNYGVKTGKKSHGSQEQVCFLISPCPINTTTGRNEVWHLMFSKDWNLQDFTFISVLIIPKLCFQKIFPALVGWWYTVALKGLTCCKRFGCLSSGAVVAIAVPVVVFEEIPFKSKSAALTI